MSPYIWDICGIAVALCALLVSIYTAYLQREHNRKSVRPICAVIEKYHAHNLAVLIVNRGLGAMTIDELSVKSRGEVRENLITLLPKVDQLWNGFSLDIKGRTILPEREVVLCAIDPETPAIRKRITRALEGIEITVRFHDVYDCPGQVRKTLRDPRILPKDLGYRAK